jgi:uncharacterized protein YkwD
LGRVAGVVALAGWVAACNLVTGADDLGVSDDDDNGGGGEAGAGAAGGGSPSSGPTSGAGGASSSGSGTSSGGDITSTGAGGASSASSSSSSSGAGGSSSSSSASSGSGGGSTCGGAGPATTPLDAEEQSFLTIINNYRASNGLGALTACISLNRAAQGHSEDMRDQNYFDHTGLDGDSPWDRACEACFDLGCGPATAMAENIAAGNSGAQATFDQWQNSPGHNANMLNGSFTMIGIGRATGGGMYGVYWTNVFAGNDEPSCY